MRTIWLLHSCFNINTPYNNSKTRNLFLAIIRIQVAVTSTVN